MIMYVLLCYPVSIHMSRLLSTGCPIFKKKNAVYLQNRGSCPFPVDASCIWPQMRPWSSFRIFLQKLQNTKVLISQKLC